MMHSVRRSLGRGQGPGCGSAATASHRGVLPVSSKAPALPVISRPNSCQGSRPQSQEGDRMMASQDVFVGIDVSKDRLDVHVRPLGVGFSVSNEAAGYAALIARLRPLRVKRIVLEATGGYERALWLALSEAGLVVGVVNPRQVREFARAAGRLAKTDRLDAAVIAHFAETFAPRIGKPDPVADRLGEHVLYRRSLQDELVALEHQRRRLETPALRERADRRHAALRAELKEIEREMRAIVAPQPRQRHPARLPGHRRRAPAGAQRALRGDIERGALEPSDQGVLSPAVGQRQAAQGGSGGLHAQDAGDAQWPGAR